VEGDSVQIARIWRNHRAYLATTETTAQRRASFEDTGCRIAVRLIHKAFVGGNSFVIEHTLISAEHQILLPTVCS
jgi:hypothetical protein